MSHANDTDPLVLRAEAIRLSREAVLSLAREIPGDPTAVDRLLAQCADGHFARAFTALSLAALHAGVAVDARHLVRGARLLPDPVLIGKISARMEGDVVGALLGAVEEGRLSWERESAALYLAAHRGRESGIEPHKAGLVRQARMLVREACGFEVEVLLAAASLLLADDQLTALVRRRPAGRLLPVAADCAARFIEGVGTPLLDGLDDDDDGPEVVTTRRRAAPRVGRNDPCPCGSGRKYKRCCEEKDRERLRDSSDVAGVTRTELRLHLEEHLDLERAHSLRAHELARLDPRRVDPRLHGVVLNQLVRYEEWDALLRFFDTVGSEDRYAGHVCDAAEGAIRAGRIETARRFLERVPSSGDEWLGLYERLLRSGLADSRALDLIEAEARKSLDGGGVDVAFDLLWSPWPCLGILAARGAAPLANPWDREALREDLGLARDRLGLPAIDPTEELEDLWGDDELEPFDERPRAHRQEHAAEASDRSEAGPERPKDDGVERRLADTETELARLRQELALLHGRLEERQGAKPEPPVGAPAQAEPEAATEDPRVAALKQRVSALKSALSQRHSERNQLRRQLEREKKRIDALEAARASAELTGGPDDDDERDDDGAEPADAGLTLAFRIPVFTRRFRASAANLPEPVRRRAVVLASRIAAGDEAALRGTKRLARDRELFRQRVGREHRMIFRLHDQELEAVDLVARKDLERTIRELTHG